MKLNNVYMSTVIFVEGTIGEGAKEDPIRKIRKFYLPNGVLIGELDGNQGEEVSDKALSASFSARIK